MNENILYQRLENLQVKHLWRTRISVLPISAIEVKANGRKLISFASNNYLGLSNHPEIIKAFVQGAYKYGLGNGASQLISGHSYAHRALENAFAEFLQCDSALLFSSGYLANLGVINALSQRGDIIYADRQNHASLVDASLLTTADFKRYQHCDANHLQQMLSLHSSPGKKIILTDSVFSMSGAIAPMLELVNLANDHQALFVVDDAHGVGVLGKQGRGIIEFCKLSQNDIPIITYPLGKAFGSFGAIVAGKKIVIDNLIQYARTYIYTTAIPSAVAYATQKSLELIQKEEWRRDNLTYLINYFNEGVRQRQLSFLPSITPIQAFLVKDSELAMWFAQKLFDLGFFVSVIRPPSVAKGTARLRITLNCLHKKIHIDQLLDCLLQLSASIPSSILMGEGQGVKVKKPHIPFTPNPSPEYEREE